MSYENGRLPSYALSNIPGGQLANGAPSKSWLAMRYCIARKSKGSCWLVPTGPNSSYRTYAKQVEYYAAYQNGTGPVAAVPGHSFHGLAKAVDIPTAEQQWFVRKYGYVFNWGILGGKFPSDSTTEPWHCRYVGQSKLTPRARYWYLRYKASRKK